MTSLDKSSSRISGMFDAIAPRYDLLNLVLSGGLDRWWRHRAIRSLGFRGGETLVDVCCGTGDVALTAVRSTPGAQRVIAVDFAAAMLVRAAQKSAAAGTADRIAVVRGDATQLPLPASSVDAVTVAFGIRNVDRPEVAIAEFLRVLRPGGRLAILEFGLPVVPAVRPLYLWYFSHVLPLIGRLVSRHQAAYTYLPESVGSFPWGEPFARMLRDAGFVEVTARPLSLGIVYLYTGRAKGRPAGGGLSHSLPEPRTYTGSTA